MRNIKRYFEKSLMKGIKILFEEEKNKRQQYVCERCIFLKKKKIKSISIVLNTIKIFLESKNKIYQNIEEIII